VRDARPVPLPAELLSPQLERADSEVVGEFDVGIAIPDHGGSRPVDVAVLEQRRDEPEPRLARRCVVGRVAAVDQHLAERDALALEHLHHQVMRPIEALARIGVGAEAVLVADDDEIEAGVADLQHRGDHVRAELPLVTAFQPGQRVEF
jgi:hypothetical protein